MSQEADKQAFEHAIQALEAELAVAGVMLTIDVNARQIYSRQIKAMSAELRIQAQSGRITWKQAASQANETRNIVMDVIRKRSTPVGAALAQKLKSDGLSLNELIAKKTLQKYGENADFTGLSKGQQNAIYTDIVKSAGKSNPKVNSLMKKLSPAGRGLIFLSVALSVYAVATAEDKVDAAAEELAVAGAGVLGGITGGAVAGLACGPGAPVCVAVGAFIGGALAAFGTSALW